MVIPPLFLQIPGSLPFKATFDLIYSTGLSKTVVYNFLGVMLKKKIVGALDGHQNRITEYWFPMCIRQYRNISYDIGKITI